MMTAIVMLMVIVMIVGDSDHGDREGGDDEVVDCEAR
jgi:hypothetical protein